MCLCAKTNQNIGGELSGYREELEKRNREIIRSFKAGDSMEYLAEKYYLSVYAIRKIIYQ